MRIALLLCGQLLAVSSLWAQEGDPPGDPLTNEGVDRAAALIESVFIDRYVPYAVVDGGDWGSYMMAQLGVYPIPGDLLFRVTVDTSHMEMFGRIADLPIETRQVLAPMLAFFDPETMVRARIELRRLGPEVIDFRLASVSINGVDFPEGSLARFMTQIGAQYPVLTKTGRNLLVKVPRDAEVTLEDGGVRIEIVDGGRQMDPRGLNVSSYSLPTPTTHDRR
jgi:hypothetical protein